MRLISKSKVIQYAKDNRYYYFDTATALQSLCQHLGVSVFYSFKLYYNIAFENWMSSHPEIIINYYLQHLGLCG